MSTENAYLIEAIARDAIALTGPARPSPPAPLATKYHEASAAALTRMSELVDLQLRAPDESDDIICLAARIVVQTWMFGHGLLLLEGDVEADLARCAQAERALVLGPSPGDLADDPLPSLRNIARRLDAHMYGASDPPRAFQRHLMSFYDEIDIARVEVTHLSRAASPGPPPARVDYLRVSLWVLLFLAHDHNDAIGATDHARAARLLFDRLRAATDAFYAERRQARSGASG